MFTVTSVRNKLRNRRERFLNLCFIDERVRIRGERGKHFTFVTPETNGFVSGDKWRHLVLVLSYIWRQMETFVD